MNSKAAIRDRSHWLAVSGLLDPAPVEQARISARAHAQPLVKYLVDNQLMDASSIAAAAARHFSLPLVDIDALQPATRTLPRVSPELIRRYRALPLLKPDATLWLGVSDPAEDHGLNEFSFQAGCKTDIVVVEESMLNRALQDLLDTCHAPGRASELSQLDFDAIPIQEDAGTPADDAGGNAGDTPVTRVVNRLLLDAIRRGASDIHVECYEHTARIRFREDGLLREIARPPLAITGKIGALLKIMARLDIAEKRLPQDGRFRLRLSRARAMELRVSTLPTLWGEKTVLRVLDPQPDNLDMDSLGFTAEQKRLYTQALHRQQGLILVTGPTGSGKSLTLYTGLNLLNNAERNIATVEDPVEIHLDGINQVSVNAAVGLGFSETLRAFLRQDPDVLMVGEIRDLETARIAVRAAQTGHLVLSTLHTNSAAETLTRLVDMGIAPYHLATSLSLVIAQRLLRRLCTRCKKPLHLPSNVLIQEGFSPDSIPEARLFAPAGCNHCHGGYRGRVGIYETVAITEAFSRVMMAGGNSIQIAELARNKGFNDLRRSALEKAAQGLTSLAEVNRMT